MSFCEPEEQPAYGNVLLPVETRETETVRPWKVRQGMSYYNKMTWLVILGSLVICVWMWSVILSGM